MNMTALYLEDVIETLEWALAQIPEDLDPDHQEALAAARAALAQAKGGSMSILLVCASLAVIWTFCPWWLALPITLIGLLCEVD